MIDDELTYEGAGDGFGAEDAVESHLGAFLGGGYASTGYKPANKKGQYFWGRFDPREHRAAEHLQWLREQIDRNIPFWKMQPTPLEASIFQNASGTFRAMSWEGNAYVLGTDLPREKLLAQLPTGRWTVKRYDVLSNHAATIARSAQGAFPFDAPASRATLFVFRKEAAIR